MRYLLLGWGLVVGGLAVAAPALAANDLPGDVFMKNVTPGCQATIVYEDDDGSAVAANETIISRVVDPVTGRHIRVRLHYVKGCSAADKAAAEAALHPEKFDHAKWFGEHLKVGKPDQ